MILDHRLRVAVCTVPKCGTLSLQAAIRDREGVEYVPGRHGCRVPPSCEGYRRLQTCRDPWSRTVSAWKFVARHWEAFPDGDAIRGMTFPEYVRLWKARRPGHEGWIEGHGPWAIVPKAHVWYVTQLEFASRWRPDGLLRVESLDADLEAWGLGWGPVGRENASDAGRVTRWWEHYDEETWERVAVLYGDAEARWLGYGGTRPGVLGAAAGEYADWR
jgi:hypothetical protein